MTRFATLLSVSQRCQHPPQHTQSPLPFSDAKCFFLPVSFKVLIHEGINFDRELYLAILLDRAHNGPICMLVDFFFSIVLCCDSNATVHARGYVQDGY